MSKGAETQLESIGSEFAVAEVAALRTSSLQLFLEGSLASRIIPLLLFLLIVFAPVAYAGAQTIAIPSVSGPLTIDGLVNEDIWKQAAVLPMQPTDYGPAFPQGGETRALVRGRYLCLGARLPETGPVVARSTGRESRFLARGLDHLDHSLPRIWRDAHDQASIRSGLTGLPPARFRGNRPSQSNVGIECTAPESWIVYRILIESAEMGRSWRSRCSSPPQLEKTSGVLNWRFRSATSPMLVFYHGGESPCTLDRIRPELRWYWPGPAPGLAFPSARRRSFGRTADSLVRKDWTTPIVKARSGQYPSQAHPMRKSSGIRWLSPSTQRLERFPAKDAGSGSDVGKEFVCSGERCGCCRKPRLEKRSFASRLETIP